MRELFKSIGVSLDNRGPAGSWRDLFGYFRKNVIQIFDEIELASAFCFIEKVGGGGLGQGSFLQPGLSIKPLIPNLDG